MSDEPEVTVVAVLVASEGRADELLQTLTRSAVGARSEEGCLRYELHRDTADPNRVVAVERYRSQVALLEHRVSAHVAEMSKGLQVPGLLATKPLLIYATPVDAADAASPSPS